MGCEGGYCCQWSSVACGRSGCSEFLLVSFSLKLKLAKECKIRRDAFDRRQVITYTVKKKGSLKNEENV